MIDPTVTLIATVPAIVALVNFAKKLGVPAKGALVLAVVWGVGLSVAQFAFAGNGYYEAAAGGLLLGLAAAGLYDLVPEASTDGADTVRELMTAGYEDDRTDVVEFAIGDTVYAGPANTMVDPGEEIRPVEILGLAPVGGDVEPERARDDDLVM